MKTASPQAQTRPDKILPMKWVEKLAALTKGKNKSALSRKAGMQPNAISTYLSPREEPIIPLVTAGLALARVLEVDPFWLFDDAQGLPPRKPGEGLSVDDLIQATSACVDQMLVAAESVVAIAESVPWMKAFPKGVAPFLKIESAEKLADSPQIEAVVLLAALRDCMLHSLVQQEIRASEAGLLAERIDKVLKDIASSPSARRRLDRFAGAVIEFHETYDLIVMAADAIEGLQKKLAR